MKFVDTKLEGCFIIEPRVIEDSRGWFARNFCKEDFRQIGHNKEWVQLNHSVTYKKGSLRGMHYQLPPFAETKMVRCISGSVYDVVVDLRQNSPTFLSWFAVELSATNKKMIYIPEGFCHGFQTLSDDCQLIYHHTAMYMPGSEGGIRFDDAVLKIIWPLAITEISDRDRSHAYLENNFKGISL